VKITKNLENAVRESRNYKRINSGVFGGSFVRSVEFLPDAGSDFSGQSALLMARGEVDVKTFVGREGGLEGRALRAACAAAARCVQSCHYSSMVYTDLKTDNMVVTAVSEDGEPLVSKERNRSGIVEQERQLKRPKTRVSNTCIIHA